MVVGSGRDLGKRGEGLVRLVMAGLMVKKTSRLEMCG